MPCEFARVFRIKMPGGTLGPCAEKVKALNFPSLT